MLQAIAGHDPADPTSARVDVPHFATSIGRSLAGLRIGVERHNHLYGPLVQAELPACFEEAVEELGRAGAAVEEVEIPYYHELGDATMLTLIAEGEAYHRQHLREQWSAFGRPTRVALASGLMLNAGDYVAAQRARRFGRRLLDRIFADVDLIVCPTTATDAPPIPGGSAEHIDASLFSTLYTLLWSGMGNPALSIPMGFSARGLPFGLQIVGRPFEEVAVLRAADAYQRATNWHLREPHWHTEQSPRTPFSRSAGDPPPSQAEALVRAALADARIDPPEDDVRLIVGMHADRRRMAASVRNLPGVDEEAPELVLKLAPSPVSDY
jgi:aspartyl-tRNA(Asn)/glutamyl-tRNA(Gln) amidotransferase subunit A